MRDIKAPLGLIGVSFFLFALAGFLGGGLEAAGAVVIGVGIGLVLNIVLAVIALYITASILRIDFGPPAAAVVKLAAVYCVPAAISILIPIPIVEPIVALICYAGLLAWFFRLSIQHLIICVIILFVVRLAGSLIVAAMISGMGG